MGTELQTIELSTPGKDIESYLSSVHSIPILTPVQERELAQKLYDNDDLDAARQLVLAHLRFVVHISRTYPGYGLPLADIIQEGNVGLMKAVDRFDPNKGVRLVSFAVHWIKAEIHEFILRNWRIVRVATTKAQKKLFFNLRSKKKALGWLGHKEAAQIAADLGVKPETVVQMEGRLAAADASFDLSHDDDDDALVPSPAQFLASEAANPADIVAEENASADELARLKQALKHLDPRAEAIVTRRWLNETKATLHELADEYGISAERVRQLEQAAMKKLRSAMGQLSS